MSRNLVYSSVVGGSHSSLSIAFRLTKSKCTYWCIKLICCDVLLLSTDHVYRQQGESCKLSDLTDFTSINRGLDYRMTGQGHILFRFGIIIIKSIGMLEKV